MWLFTPLGFFSVVNAGLGDGFSIDPKLVMIRVRMREHLENLKVRFPTELNAVTIAHSRDTDYRYRMIIKKTVWAKLVSQLVRDIAYPNFKSEVAKNKDHVLSGYEHSLHAIWSVMYGLQSNAERGR